jgi:hypothetical protein
MRGRCMEKGVSLGEEAVLAASGWAGAVGAGGVRMKRGDSFASC